jgi:uncharacterized membrane protein
MGSVGVDWHVLLAQIINCVLFVLPFVLIGLVIWLVIRHQKINKDRTPLDIANDMYAKGKITFEELEQIRTGLQKS